MRRKYAGITGIALLAVLGFPGVSHASIWDWIWSMSGPQMIGVVFHCEYDWEHNNPNKKAHECRIFDYRIIGEAESRKLRANLADIRHHRLRIHRQELRRGHRDVGLP